MTTARRVTRRARTLAVAHAIVVIAAATVCATTHADSARWSLAADNDDFNFWQTPSDRPDFGYTHGTRIAVSLPRAPGFLAHLPPAWMAGSDALSPARLTFAVEQDIYSPWVLPADRPYAGWLEAAAGVRREGQDRSREAIFHVGVTGPPSQAEKVQRWIHHHYHQGTPSWQTQLPYEWGLGFETQGRQRQWSQGARAAATIEGGPEWRVRFGTYAIDARIAYRATAGWRPPNPWGTPVHQGPIGVYGIAVAKLDLIARDEFLDGTLFRPSPGVSASPIVGEFESGAGIRIGSANLEWRVHRRTKEYELQPEMHTYSTLSLEWTGR